jgi:hypothetical protein
MAAAYALLCDPDGAGGRFLRNDGNYVPGYTESHPRSQQSSQSTPQVSQFL